MSLSKNAYKTARLSPTLVSYLKRFINESSESSFIVQQIKKITTISSLAFLFMISGMVHLSAQEIGDKVSIQTKGGNIIYGTLIADKDSIVSIETPELGLVSLTRNRIVKMRPAILRSDGTYWFENPNYTRNLFSPTAINLRKGEANYQNTMLFLQTFNYGVTDNISFGAGFEIASILFTDNQSPFFTLSSKISTASEKGLNTAAGIMVFNSKDDNEFSATIIYSATTIGDRDDNFTLGIGLIKDDIKWREKPALIASAMTRMNKRFGLVTENWILPSRNYGGDNISFLFSVGGRYITTSITVDFAFVFSSNLDGFRIPWLGITLPIRK